MKTTDLLSMAGAIILPCGDIRRIMNDGEYRLVEQWTATGNKVCRYELRNARPHGRSTEWDPETGNIISDEYYQDGHRIDIHCNRIY